MNVRVTSMDAELEFVIQPNTTGKQLFDQVVKAIGLREVWFFGLQYTTSKGDLAWIKLFKKLTGQDVRKEKPLQFNLLAKFYPEVVEAELHQNITLRLFYLQVKNAILSDEIYCPPESCVLLASYAAQARHGDYNASLHKSGFLSNERLLPPRVLDQHKFIEENWEDLVTRWWLQHKGMMRDEAMMEYLKNAQDLEMYGVNYFEIINKKGTELWLGVDALGLNIYEKDDKLTPKIGLAWSEICSISFNDRKFKIKSIEKNGPDITFQVPRVRTNKLILAMCMGNHEMYMRRRKPDPIDVQQMKVQAREEKIAKQQQKERLQVEISAREMAEEKQAEYGEQMMKMSEKLLKTQKDLIDALDYIKGLEDQIRLIQTTKDDLQERQNGLQELIDSLDSTSSEGGEQSKFVEETKRLQLEVEGAHNLIGAALEAAQMRILPQRHDEDNEQEHIDGNVSGDEMQKMQNASNLRKENKFNDLKEMLSQNLDETKETAMDRMHQDNIRAGRDKFKTLREIREGSIKRRVDEYENL